MHGLVLIADGSRRQASNHEVMDLSSRLQQFGGDLFQLVETGFLEIANPSIPETIEYCIQTDTGSASAVRHDLLLNLQPGQRGRPVCMHSF